MNTIKKSTEALTITSREIDLAGNVHEKNTQQICNMKVADKSTENVEKFKYLGTVTNQNHIHEKIKSRLNLKHA